jgi:hypothetical protein
MTPEDYAEKIVGDFMRNITDHVFLNIQHTEELMREYQSQVHENSLELINRAIGKKVREMFDLANCGESDAPKSWLIKSFTLHEKEKK